MEQAQDLPERIQQVGAVALVEFVVAVVDKNLKITKGVIMKSLMLSILMAVTAISAFANNARAAFTRAVPVQEYRVDYASTSVTSGVVKELVASSSGKIQLLDVYNGCSYPLKLYTGASGSEVGQKWYIFPSGNILVDVNIAASTRLSVKAVNTTCATGELLINAYRY